MWRIHVNVQGMKICQHLNYHVVGSDIRWPRMPIVIDVGEELKEAIELRKRLDKEKIRCIISQI